MKLNLRGRACLGLVVLVALVSCNKNTSETTVREPSIVPYELQDAGGQPRDTLRYAIPDGTTTRADMLIKVAPADKKPAVGLVSGIRSLKIQFDLGPAKNVDGHIQFPAEVAKARATVDPNSSKAVTDEVKRRAAELVGAGALLTINDIGRYVATQSNDKLTRAPLSLLFLVYNITDAMGLMVLPEEPVGVGARWTVRGRRMAQGILMMRSATYTLVEREGNRVVLDLEYERLGSRDVDKPDEEGMPVVEASRLAGSGRIVLELDDLTADASATGRVYTRTVTLLEGEVVREQLFETLALKIKGRPPGRSK